MIRDLKKKEIDMEKSKVERNLMALEILLQKTHNSLFILSLIIENKKDFKKESQSEFPLKNLYFYTIELVFDDYLLSLCKLVESPPKQYKNESVWALLNYLADNLKILQLDTELNERLSIEKIRSDKRRLNALADTTQALFAIRNHKVAHFNAEYLRLFEDSELFIRKAPELLEVCQDIIKYYADIFDYPLVNSPNIHHDLSFLTKQLKKMI